MQTSPPGNPKRSNSSGFSLFELLVVLILLGAAAAVVLPSFTRGLRGLELDTAARDLVTHMRQARTQAVSQQRVFRIILHPARHTGAAAFYVMTDEFGRVLRRFPLPDGAGFRGEAPEGAQTISFYPNGRSSGGSFAVAGEGGKSLRLWVDPVTGFARTLRNEEDLRDTY